MTGELVECPQCEGAGMLGECANDGTHGCSHTNDREWPCPLCKEEGVVTVEERDAWWADRDAELALRLNAVPPRPVTTVPGVDAWGPEPF